MISVFSIKHRDRCPATLTDLKKKRFNNEKSSNDTIMRLKVYFWSISQLNNNNNNGKNPKQWHKKHKIISRNNKSDWNLLNCWSNCNYRKNSIEKWTKNSISRMPLKKNIFRKIKFDRKIVVLNSIEIKTSDWNWLLGALYDAIEPLSLFIFPCWIVRKNKTTKKTQNKTTKRHKKIIQ